MARDVGRFSGLLCGTIFASQYGSYWSRGGLTWGLHLPDKSRETQSLDLEIGWSAMKHDDISGHAEVHGQRARALAGVYSTCFRTRTLYTEQGVQLPMAIQKLGLGMPRMGPCRCCFLFGCQSQQSTPLIHV